MTLPTWNNTICAFRLDELYEFLGQYALPPWRDIDGKLIGTHIPCAPIAAQLIKWIQEHDLQPELIIVKEQE